MYNANKQPFFNMKNRLFVIGAIIATLTPFAHKAEAHVPFLKPNLFHVIHNRFQIESAYTELPFQADFAMDSPNFMMIDPNFNIVQLTPSFKTKAAVYLEPTISIEGTYRISTGVRKGPRYRGIQTTEGKKYFSDDTLRVKGQNILLQYYNSADVYIYKGKSPNYKPNPLNKGVEIIPLTSPNQVKKGDKITFRVLNEGKIVPNARIVVVYDNEHYEYHRKEDLYDVENTRKSNIYANAKGEFTFRPNRAGLVMLFVTIHKHIEGNLWDSYNTALTMEVMLP